MKIKFVDCLGESDIELSAVGSSSMLSTDGGEPLMRFTFVEDGVVKVEVFAAWTAMPPWALRKMADFQDGAGVWPEGGSALAVDPDQMQLEPS